MDYKAGYDTYTTQVCEWRIEQSNYPTDKPALIIANDFDSSVTLEGIITAVIDYAIGSF